MLSERDLLRLQRTLDKCPRCGKSPMIVDGAGGEFLCGSCGFVVKDKMEEVGPEWRAFSNEEKNDRSRGGPPTSVAVHDMGLATVIGRANKDATGKQLSSLMRFTVRRMRTWDGRSQVHEQADRNLRQAFGELDRLSEKLAASDVVVERAAYVYRKALERGLVRGRSISGIIAASLYAACRDTQTPRTLKDVAAASVMKKKDIAGAYRLLLRELDVRMPVADPVRCIPRIASSAGISEKTSRRAFEILKRAKANSASAGKAPMGLAAAALYVACVLEGEAKPQKEIAEAAGVTEVTIRNRYKSLRSDLGI